MQKSRQCFKTKLQNWYKNLGSVLKQSFKIEYKNQTSVVKQDLRL